MHMHYKKDMYIVKLIQEVIFYSLVFTKKD